MNTERDTTRVVRSWLESGSTAIPDRVLDAVLAELPSRPQRRSRWSLWRFLPMKPIIPVAVGAAAVLLAIVLGTQILPDNSSVGGPTPRPSAAPSTMSGVVEGQFTYFLLGEIVNVDMRATVNGSSLSGSADVAAPAGTFAGRLECARQVDDRTWMLAGEVEQTSMQEPTVGTWMSLIVRDGSPQEAGIVFADEPTADDCAEFVREIPASAVDSPVDVFPLTRGQISLP